MGLLSNLFGGKKQAAAAEVIAVECPHSVLVARWDSVQDMGIEDKATRFMCETCKEMFDPAEAARLRDTLAERIAAATIVETPEGDGAAGAS
jgi:hypothetical protein